MRLRVAGAPPGAREAGSGAIGARTGPSACVVPESLRAGDSGTNPCRRAPINRGDYCLRMISSALAGRNEWPGPRSAIMNATWIRGWITATSLGLLSPTGQAQDAPHTRPNIVVIL